MTAEEFVYYVNGFLDALADADTVSNDTLDVLRQKIEEVDMDNEMSWELEEEQPNPSFNQQPSIFNPYFVTTVNGGSGGTGGSIPTSTKTQ